MSCREVDFKDVFDDSEHFSPKAIVRLALSDFAEKRGFHPVSGEDGLDAFLAVPLVLEQTQDARPVKLALWRHARNDIDTFSVQVGLSRLGEPGLLKTIMSEIGIFASDIIWESPEDRRVERPAATRVATATAVVAASAGQRFEDMLVVGRRLLGRGRTRLRDHFVIAPIDESGSLHGQERPSERGAAIGGVLAADDALTDKAPKPSESSEESVVAEKVCDVRDASHG